ncbi:Thioredoxin-1 [Planctomycetes bacterium Pan216]|uniref:Thioredoxin-1 n=1 Tax=Kolteria novifilia TaxID=2527975 RepID=A0A518BD72_9BACT|nr:Thioredoxin-1 [Planctomycetes bacterium Pan216]
MSTFHKSLSLALLVGALSAVGSAQAAGVAWRDDMTSALNESRQSGKPVLMTFTASWCHYCHRMFDETFSNDRVARHINGCFVPLKVDVDANPSVARAIGVRSFPTTMVLTADQVVLRKLSGYQDVPRFLKGIDGLCPKQRPLAAKTTPLVAARAEERPEFGGVCLVSMLEEQQLRRGDERFMVREAGMTYHFASQAKADRFRADPKRYLPVAGGACVMSTGGMKGDVRHAAVYIDRLWLFSGESSRERFLAAPYRFVPEDVKREWYEAQRRSR